MCVCARARAAHELGLPCQKDLRSKAKKTNIPERVSCHFSNFHYKMSMFSPTVYLEKVVGVRCVTNPTNQERWREREREWEMERV